MKGKFEILQSGTTVVFRVVEMDERFRSVGDWDHGEFGARESETNLFVSSQGIDIMSEDTPEIVSLKEVFLRGHEIESDNDYVLFGGFDNETERSIFVEKLKAALSEWANEWEGWKQDEPKEACSDRYFVV